MIQRPPTEITDNKTKKNNFKTESRNPYILIILLYPSTSEFIIAIIELCSFPLLFFAFI